MKVFAKELGLPIESVGNYSDDDENDEEDEEAHDKEAVEEGPFKSYRATYVVDEDGRVHEAYHFDLPDKWSGSGAREMILFQANGALDAGEGGVEEAPEKKSNAQRRRGVSKRQQSTGK